MEGLVLVGTLAAFIAGGAALVYVVKTDTGHRIVRQFWVIVACLLIAIGLVGLAAIPVGQSALLSVHPLRTIAVCTATTAALSVAILWSLGLLPAVARRSKTLRLGDAERVPYRITVRSHAPANDMHVFPLPVQWAEVDAWFWRVPVTNHGRPSEVKVKITKIHPAMSDVPVPAPLHVRDDPEPYREVIRLDHGETELYDLVSLGRTTLDLWHPVAGAEDAPQVFVHDIRGPGGVRSVRTVGDYEITVTAYAGDEHASRLYAVHIEHITLDVR